MITSDLNLIQSDNQLPYLITNESNSINTINSFNNNNMVISNSDGLIQITDFSTETTNSGGESLNDLSKKEISNKIVYNGVEYFNVVEDDSHEKELELHSSILELDNKNINNMNSNNNNDNNSFAQLETISTIQTDNQNKLIQNNVNINNNNSRIDFDLENFFTHSSLLIKEPSLVSVNNDLNNQQAQYVDLTKTESNLILDYNNTNDVTNGLNSFKIFSINHYMDDSRF